MAEPGWDRIQPSRLTDPELPGGIPQNAGQRTFAGEGREPESKWTNREKALLVFDRGVADGFLCCS